MHEALAVEVELVLTDAVDRQKLRVGNRLDARKVLSENTMYGGLPISWAMVRRSSRSFWNSDSSSSSGIYEPSASPGTLAESAVSATPPLRPEPAASDLRSTRLIS